MTYGLSILSRYLVENKDNQIFHNLFIFWRFSKVVGCAESAVELWNHIIRNVWNKRKMNYNNSKL